MSTRNKALETIESKAEIEKVDIHDRVMDAYYGRLGQHFMRATQERIHWVCGNADGEKILDVGCSQGLVPILLARQGFEVTGVDIDPKSIQEAEAYVAQESDDVKKNVTLVSADFMNKSLSLGQYHTIVMSEVLEHLVQPSLFIKRAYENLVVNGRIVITVPFGINDYIDHKHTFYLLEPYRIISQFFTVDDVKIFDGWIGISGKRKVESELAINNSVPAIELIELAERAFFLLERKLQDKLSLIQLQLDNANGKYRTVTEQVATYKHQSHSANSELSIANEKIISIAAEIEQLTMSKCQLQQEISDLQAELKQSGDSYIQHDKLLAVSNVKLELANQTSENNRIKYSNDISALESALEIAKLELIDIQLSIAKKDAVIAKVEDELRATELSLSEAENSLITKDIEEKEYNKYIQELKINLTAANEKYRLATGNEIPKLKDKLEQQYSQQRNTFSTLTDLKRELAQEKSLRALAEQQVIKSRQTLSFQLGYILLHQTKTLKGWFKLPSSLWAWRKQQLSRRRQRKEKEASFDLAVTSTLNKPNVCQQRCVTIASNVDDVPKLHLRKTLKETKVAAIMDDFTYSSYAPECILKQLTPTDWKRELSDFKPDMLLIESAWRGKDGKWGNKVGHNSQELQGILSFCNENDIPKAFWNKEDPVHFETFLNTAKQFDYIFTTDFDCIHRYKAALGHERVYFLPFACQPKNNNPIEVYQRKDAFCFAGAYYARYPERTRDLENFVQQLPEFKPLEIFDRNFGKDDANYKFPDEFLPYIVGTLPFEEIDKAYKGYLYAINLNSIKQSQSMFARRVFELLASNTVTVSNYSRGVRTLFSDLVICSDSAEEILSNIKEMEQTDPQLKRFRLAGLRKVMLEHTYQDRFAYLASKLSDSTVDVVRERISIFSYVNTIAELDSVMESFNRQTYNDKELVIVSKNSNINMRSFESENIRLVKRKSVAKFSLNQLFKSSDFVGIMMPQDHYGENYLQDLILARRYSDATAIGKNEYFSNEKGEITTINPDKSYKSCHSLTMRSSICLMELVENTPVVEWLKNAATIEIKTDSGLAIDPFNYCRNAISSNYNFDEVSNIVDDLKKLNKGCSLLKLTESAEVIEAATTDKVTSKYLSPQDLSSIIQPNEKSKVKLTLNEGGWQVDSSLVDGKHEYLYAKNEHSLDELELQDHIELHLETTPGVNLQWVVLFLDANKQKVSHIIKPSNVNITADIPLGTQWVRFGLRIYAGGTASIKRLVLGHINQEPSKIIERSDCLLLTNHYPSYDDLYRNGFVHSRVAAYKAAGKVVDVFRMRNDENLSFHEFKGIDVTTGSQSCLRKALESGAYKHVLVHFLDPEMWDVLKDYIETINVTVWVHGSDIQSHQRRSFLYSTEEELSIAKQKCDLRMGFWSGLLKQNHEKLHLVFVSNYLAQSVMEDLDMQLNDEQYSIIPNPIDTNLFSYVEKPSEQRLKILSVRPYASRTYANDLAVKAILELSKESFFEQLEFRMIGDGVLFEEILKPLRQFDNVIIERGFITQQRISELHKEYGVFLCPSRMDTQGVSRDEAMASGLVPITNAVGAIPEFVDEGCATLAPDEDYISLAKGMKELYSDPSFFISKSQNAAIKAQGTSGYKKIISLEISLSS